MDSPPVPINTTLDKIIQWISLADRLLPVLLIMNFLSETRLVKANDMYTTSQNNSEILMGGGVALLALFMLVLGVRIEGESYGQTHISGKATLLAQPFDTRSYSNSKGDTMLYRLLKPLHYDQKKRYPLVICLPYTCWDDNIRQIEACPPAQWLSSEENRKKYPSFAIPVCGAGDPTLAHNLTDVSVWAFHGENDRNVPVSGSREMIKAIKKTGGRTHYTEFPNAGHLIWEDVEKTPHLLDWLFAQKKTNPKKSE